MAMLLCWPFPEPNQYALDVDGCFYRSLEIAGYGGLIRDHEGNWIIGFSGPAEFTDSLHLEFLAILQGLSLAWEIGVKNVSVRSDSRIALDLIRNSTPQPHQYSQIIDQIKELKSRDWLISFVHTHQESNQCADLMARIGATTMKCMGYTGIFEDPPIILSSQLKADAERTTYTRGFRSHLAML